jgi:hypothetical protein
VLYLWLGARRPTADLVEKHKALLDQIKWKKNIFVDLIQAVKCDLIKGLINEFGEVNPLTAIIYVDHILGASVFNKNTTTLLTASIEAIFLVHKEPDIALHQCLLSLEK